MSVIDRDPPGCPEPDSVVRQIGAHGFGAVQHKALTFGVTGLYAAERQLS